MVGYNYGSWLWFGNCDWFVPETAEIMAKLWGNFCNDPGARVEAPSPTVHLPNSLLKICWCSVCSTFTRMVTMTKRANPWFNSTVGCPQGVVVAPTKTSRIHQWLAVRCWKIWLAIHAALGHEVNPGAALHAPSGFGLLSYAGALCLSVSLSDCQRSQALKFKIVTWGLDSSQLPLPSHWIAQSLRNEMLHLVRHYPELYEPFTQSINHEFVLFRNDVNFPTSSTNQLLPPHGTAIWTEENPPPTAPRCHDQLGHAQHLHALSPLSDEAIHGAIDHGHVDQSWDKLTNGFDI